MKIFDINTHRLVADSTYSNTIISTASSHDRKELKVAFVLPRAPIVIDSNEEQPK